MNHDEETDIGEQLAEWGKVGLLETRGRLTGRPARVAVGFVEDSDGSLLIAAGSERADWALNLRVHPECALSIGGAGRRYVAQEVEGTERAAALTRLILKYGTPAERLGHGPVFRLGPFS